MVTKKSYYAMEDVDALRAEIDERDAILSNYGSTYKEEDEGEWEFSANPVEDYRDQYTALEAKYAGLSARYAELLNNPEPTHSQDNVVDEGENKVEDTDHETIKISDLITEREE